LQTSKLISRIIILSFILTGCSIFQTVENISRLKYKIHSANEYKIAGINVKDKKSLKDFSSLEVLKITASAMKGTLPITFNLNVEAKNPNDGSGGYPATDLTIQSFPWRLLINDQETITGNIEHPITVPGKGEATIISLKVEFDLAKNFKEKNIDDIIDLALQIAGIQKSTSNLKLKVHPVIGTALGNIKYPDEITIVDKTYN